MLTMMATFLFLLLQLRALVLLMRLSGSDFNNFWWGHIPVTRKQPDFDFRDTLDRVTARGTLILCQLSYVGSIEVGTGLLIIVKRSQDCYKNTASCNLSPPQA